MTIILHTPDTIYSARHTPSWFLLAAAAGQVNAFAFLTCEQFATHITGTVTRVGLEWPHVGIAAEYLSVVLSLVAGAMTSVIWIQARVVRGRRPRWATPLIAVALILVGTALAGWAGWFGSFGGKHVTDPPPFILLSILAFAMGLQNGAVGSTTGLAVRTTHVTGPATDFGIHLGVAYFTSGKERRAAFRGAVLRGGKILSFIVGAGVALPLAVSFNYLALLAPALFVVIASMLSFMPDWSPSDFPRQEPPTGGKGKSPAANKSNVLANV